MCPRSGSSSRVMQRSSVDWPEALGPMIATTEPRSTRSETPFSTWSEPKAFHKSAISIIKLLVCAGEPPLDLLRRQRQREQHQKVDDRDHRIDFERAIGRSGDDRALVEQIGDRNRRYQRSIFQLDDRL